MALRGNLGGGIRVVDHGTIMGRIAAIGDGGEAMMAVSSEVFPRLGARRPAEWGMPAESMRPQIYIADHGGDLGGPWMVECGMYVPAEGQYPRAAVESALAVRIANANIRVIQAPGDGQGIEDVVENPTFLQSDPPEWGSPAVKTLIEGMGQLNPYNPTCEAANTRVIGMSNGALE